MRHNTAELIKEYLEAQLYRRLAMQDEFHPAEANIGGSLNHNKWVTLFLFWKDVTLSCFS